MGMIWLLIGLALLLLAGVMLIIAGKRRYREADRMDAETEVNYAGRKERKYTEKEIAQVATTGFGMRVLGFTLAGIAVFFMALNSFTLVSARSAGVVDNLGSASDTLDSGPHLVWPWVTIHEVDGTTQTLSYDNDDAVLKDDDPNTRKCLNVRLKSGGTACPDMAVQFNVDTTEESQANELWKKYRGKNNDLIGNLGNVVNNKLQDALNQVFGAYDPLATVLGSADQTVTTAMLKAQVFDIMKTSVDTGVVITSVSMGLPNLDTITQQKLNEFTQEQANTRIAEQKKATALAIAEANKNLATQNLSPGVLYQNCLTLIDTLATRNQLEKAPQGFNCSQDDIMLLLNGGK